MGLVLSPLRSKPIKHENLLPDDMRIRAGSDVDRLQQSNDASHAANRRGNKHTASDTGHPSHAGNGRDARRILTESPNQMKSFQLIGGALMLALIVAAGGCSTDNTQPTTYQPSAATTATPPPGGLLNRQTGPGMGGRY